jgi:hypothetical protein
MIDKITPIKQDTSVMIDNTTPIKQDTSVRCCVFYPV